MVFATLATIAMAMLALSNVYSTCTALLRDGATEAVMRIELQFWVIYVIVHAGTGWFRDDKPELQLIASLFLVLCKHFDNDRAILDSIFKGSDQCLKLLDEQFIVPNTQRLLIEPCTSLLDYSLSIITNSTTITKEDKQTAAESISQNINSLVRVELHKRVKDKFQVNDSKDEASTSTEPSATSAATPKTPEKKTAKKPASSRLSYGALRKYFVRHGIPMSDDQIPKILNLYANRDDELRQKLAEKFGHPVEDSTSVSTPQSAGVVEGGTRASSFTRSVAGPATDTVPHRRRPALPR